MDLNTNLQTLGSGYKLQAKKLSKLGVQNVLDLLYHIPSRYEDYSNVRNIKGLRLGEIITIKGKVIEAKNDYRTRRFSMQKIVIEDSSAQIECRWFNQPYLIRTIRKESMLSVSGSVEFYGRVKSIAVKEFEEIYSLEQETVNTGRLVPVYPLTRGLSSKWLRNKVFDLLKKEDVQLKEFLPENLLLSHHLPELNEAINNIHFPSTFDDVEKSHNRLSYEELFLIQLAAMARREEWNKTRRAPELHIIKYKTQINKLFESLPFTLTTAQIKALDEIYADIAFSTPMNRLLEGDVGSGKTVVAAISMYIAFLNGYKSLFMAPTQILANQHYEVLKKLLEPLGVIIELRTGATKKLQAKSYKLQTDILVGTHALLNSKIDFEKVGLVVIDEQQRFGVEQRAILREKGNSPHFLTMTATPIPRTVFLTLYGDLSLSLLDEMPKGRIRVKTWLVPNEKRDKGYEWIKKKIIETDSNGNKNQVFIICPFIEASENAVTVKAAVKEYENLSRKIFKNFKVGLLHGKLKSKEKDEVLGKFEKGEIDILVATPVVEVGIDIPNATIMVIEAAERFGLSQLHQLRGRVGRRVRESFCFLFTESVSDKTRSRLKSLETIYVGAELAELDLKLRGPGDMYGTAQSGGHRLKIASFSDFKLILETKKDAQNLFLKLNEYPELKNRVDEIVESKKILPD
jgi:ATP-dependent DNA helicase RecG